MARKVKTGLSLYLPILSDKLMPHAWMDIIRMFIQSHTWKQQVSNQIWNSLIFYNFLKLDMASQNLTESLLIPKIVYGMRLSVLVQLDLRNRIRLQVYQAQMLLFGFWKIIRCSHHSSKWKNVSQTEKGILWRDASLKKQTWAKILVI